MTAYSAGVVVTKDVFMVAELRDPVFLVRAPGLVVSQTVAVGCEAIKFLFSLDLSFNSRISGDECPR